MANSLAGRHAAEIDGDFVVFLIGARFELRHPVRCFRDLGGRRGMRHMLEYLTQHPDKGLLAYEMGLPTIVEYWRSFEHLEAFARSDDDPISRPGATTAPGRIAEPDRHLARRPSWCARAGTRRSTRTCRPTAWAGPAGWCH